MGTRSNRLNNEDPQSMFPRTSSPKGNGRSPEIKQVFLNSSQVSIRFFQLAKGSQLCSPWLDPILTSIKGCNSVANLPKTDTLQSQRILSKIMCIQNLVEFCPFILKIWSKIKILALIKGCNSVANLRSTTSYNTNIDLVNDGVYTKFGLILSIHSQDIE